MRRRPDGLGAGTGLDDEAALPKGLGVGKRSGVDGDLGDTAAVVACEPGTIDVIGDASASLQRLRNLALG